VAFLEPVFKVRTTEEWISRLEAANVPCGPINRVDQVFADPQATARGFKISMAHKAAGPIDLVASPLRLSRTPPEYRNAPPVLGEHTHEVLSQILHLSASDIEGLERAKII
jgi:crotonobetainyl-CoA:carnitine CoA-transferase CaiB-like acyl-CoA transferase